jgi:hypothetical protein
MVPLHWKLGRFSKYLSTDRPKDRSKSTLFAPFNYNRNHFNFIFCQVSATNSKEGNAAENLYAPLKN